MRSAWRETGDLVRMERVDSGWGGGFTITSRLASVTFHDLPWADFIPGLQWGGFPRF
jgi:hypothetical protein